jgi:hypothetical protein
MNNQYQELKITNVNMEKLPIGIYPTLTYRETPNTKKEVIANQTLLSDTFKSFFLYTLF